MGLHEEKREHVSDTWVQRNGGLIQRGTLHIPLLDDDTDVVSLLFFGDVPTARMFDL